MVKMWGKQSTIKTRSIAKTLLTSLLITLFTVCTISSTKAQSGRAIEVHSEKALYQPQELVVLYAKVTYNQAPVAAKDVAFQVEGPPNPYINFTFTGGSRTNASGIATYSFRIPWPDVNPEASVLGKWKVVATVDIAEVVVMNTTTFKVDWIIIITRIETLNEDLQPQTSFLRKKLVVFNLTVENRAATEKIATITINVYDAKNFPIITIELENITLFPGENVLLASAQIPATASIGQATVYAMPYTALPKFGGVPYSPPASTTFQIITRDIAITEVTLSKTIVKSGETVEIKVEVINKGNETESFDVTVYYNNHVISSRHVSLLPPLTRKEITFEWDTSGVSPGNYIISASAGPVEDEIEIYDNVFIDGIITILPVPVSCDVAVTWVNAEPTEVIAGQKVQIEVKVANLGTSSQSFNVLIYYDDILITTQQVFELAPCSERKLIIQWNTACVKEGTYNIKAYIPPLPCETNIENNLYINGNVTIKAPPAPAKIHDIAIINVRFHPTKAYIGDNIDIWVDAANLGDYPETFNVTVYYNQSEIATQKIWLLQPGQKVTLHFA
ncbi:MAG: CARDB domain-containing protein, partial [Candidatus Aenigmatarchaeota archaeon]